MKCKTCKHWKRLSESDNYLPEDEIGECDGLPSNEIEISLSAGWGGATIHKIETQHDFFCANYEEI